MWLNLCAWSFFLCAGLILYTYVIYPVICAVIGGGKYGRLEDKLPGISVLVPAYNEAEVIEDKIDNFLALDYPSNNIEMLIVDDGSSDNTRDLIKAKLADNVRLLDPAPRSGKATGLNRMVKEAKHSLLLLCDANVMFAPDVAKRLAHHMLRDDVGAVTGEVRLVGSNADFESGESLYYVLERRIQGAESRLGSVMGVDGGMYLLRKELFKTLDPDTILDDFVISMQVIRSGHRIVYDSQIKATECGTPSSKQEYSRRVRMMAGVVQMLRAGFVPKWNQPLLWIQFASHKLLRWITPLLLTICLTTSSALASEHWTLMAAVYLQLFLYGFFLFACLFKQARRFRFTSIIFYFFLSQIAITEGTVKGLLNRQRVLWQKGKRVSKSGIVN